MAHPHESIAETGLTSNSAVVEAHESSRPKPSSAAERYGYIPREKFDSINTGKGLTIERHFTRAGVDPFDEIEWERRSAVITDERGRVVFEQHDVEVPAFWSQLATNVVVSKYFRGQLGTPERETSVRQVIGRVVDTLTEWGKQMRYFATDADADAFRDELKYLLLHQYGAFNTRVGTCVVYARLRRLRGRHQKRGQNPTRRQNGRPQHRPPRHRGVHRVQGEGGAKSVGAD
jgi:hypothetical protein